MSKQEAKVAVFNSEVMVGARVKVLRDNGDVLETTTRSEAWLLAGHTAVVLVEGIAGAYLLDRVKPEIKR